MTFEPLFGKIAVKDIKHLCTHTQTPPPGAPPGVDGNVMEIWEGLAVSSYKGTTCKQSKGENISEGDRIAFFKTPAIEIEINNEILYLFPAEAVVGRLKV